LESGCLRSQPRVGDKPHLKLIAARRLIANKYREGKLQRTLKRESSRGK
uniref:GTP-binding protein n=1 Tax=Gongylonema pulchrum TaxID=637853 RepID=A0A183EKJ6_9BILA